MLPSVTETTTRLFVLPYRRETAAILNELMYCDLLYRRLVLQMIFDFIIGTDEENLSSSGTRRIRVEIENFLRSYPHAKMPDVTTEELIETAEELFVSFYRDYRREIRSNFSRSPRIDFVELRHHGIAFQLTVRRGS